MGMDISRPTVVHQTLELGKKTSNRLLGSPAGDCGDNKFEFGAGSRNDPLRERVSEDRASTGEL
jgi:hypothetical protein